MNRADALEAISRERPLTDAEVNALYRAMRPKPPSSTAEGQRAWRAKHRDEINRRIRDRYANDPDYRAHRLNMNLASRQRSKG